MIKRIADLQPTEVLSIISQTTSLNACSHLIVKTDKTRSRPMCRTIIVGLTEYIDIRNSTIVRCHSNAVLVRSNAVNHIHRTLWSTMCLTIKCDQQAFKIYSFIF